MTLLDFVNSFNWQTIIGMAVISWYFTHEIKVALERQSARTDKLYEMFIELIKESKK